MIELSEQELERLEERARQWLAPISALRQARADLQEARQWIQALRDEVRVSGGWTAKAQQSVIEGANAFLFRTAPRAGGETR